MKLSRKLETVVIGRSRRVTMTPGDLRRQLSATKVISAMINPVAAAAPGNILDRGSRRRRGRPTLLNTDDTSTFEDVVAWTCLGGQHADSSNKTCGSDK